MNKMLVRAMSMIAMPVMVIAAGLSGGNDKVLAQEPASGNEKKADTWRAEVEGYNSGLNFDCVNSQRVKIWVGGELLYDRKCNYRAPGINYIPGSAPIIDRTLEDGTWQINYIPRSAPSNARWTGKPGSGTPVTEIEGVGIPIKVEASAWVYDGGDLYDHQVFEWSCQNREETTSSLKQGKIQIFYRIKPVNYDRKMDNEAERLARHYSSPDDWTPPGPDKCFLILLSVKPTPQ